MASRPPRPDSSSAFVAAVCETLAPLGAPTGASPDGVRARRMFGGYGLYCDGLMFALVADETLYFKVDDGNRAAYEALGLEPFRPFAGKPTALPYRPPPESALDDPDELLDWARPALEAALRAAARKRSGKRDAG